MTNLFVLFQCNHVLNDYEWLVRGISHSVNDALGLLDQCRLIITDEFELSDWVIEEVPVGLPLVLNSMAGRKGSRWIVDGAVAKYDTDGVEFFRLT